MKKIKIDLLILLVVLGVLLSLQYKVMSSGQKYVKIQDLYLLKNEIKSDKATIEQYRVQIEQKKLELEKYREDDGATSVAVKKKLEADLIQNMAVLGKYPLVGQGVVLIITDSSRDIGSDENPNDLVVHDVDIRTLVDDLFAAGAEAISINNTRILLTERDIVCTGPSINVNGKYLSQPFVIKAIGDTDYLMSAINAPGKYGSTLKDWGIYLELFPSLNVEVEAYEGVQTGGHLNQAKE